MKKTCFLFAGVLSLFCIVTCYGPPERTEDTRDPSSEYYSKEYPYPFSPTNTIEFETSDSAKVSMVVYDVNGEAVDIVVDTVLSPGRHVAKWDGTGFLSGIYFYKITEISIPTGDTTITSEKFVLLK